MERTPSGSAYRELWQAATCLPRHRHAAPYAALIVAGGYEECGSFGRVRVGPGDVVLHARFEAHLDRFGTCKTEILNLGLPTSPSGLCVGKISDVDYVVRLAERDAVTAAAAVLEQLTPRASALCDWPDLLAADLLLPAFAGVRDWARCKGLAPETVTRGFARMFGVPPLRFRLERRALAALSRITHSHAPLAQIAAESGFADQAHMTRAVKALSGAPPSHWRHQMHSRLAHRRF